METETITLYASDFDTKKDYYNTKQEFLMLGFTVKESSKLHFTLCKDHPIKNKLIEGQNSLHASILNRNDTPEYFKFKKK